VPIADAVRWTIQAADAIGYSSAAGIIHCDLKPANLVLDRQQDVRVTDFGLAMSIDANGRAIDRIAGTAPYMAPEQVSAWWGSIGPHTDVYGLGAVLYTLLTGRAPYKGATLTDVLSRVVSGVQPTAPETIRPSVGPGLAAIVAKCLVKDPSDRYHSAAELTAALKNT
jgi:serine/threonine-protein kinase